MSDPHRREFLTATAGIAALATLSGSQQAAAGDPELQEQRPRPALCRARSCRPSSSRWRNRRARSIGNSYGKEATVEQLPISKGIAGVSMRLEPGAMRELHWHATAAEWAFVARGPRPHHGHRSAAATPRPTTSSPATSGTSRAATATCSQCLGDKPCHFILIFDNGYFSEFGTFSITDWIGHTPKALLAKNFGLPESAFDGFPKEEVYFARGPVAAGGAAVPLQGWKPPPRDAQVPAAGAGAALRSTRAAASGASMPAASRSRRPSPASILDLEPGALRELHWHPNADEWQYVIEGEVSVTLFGSHGRYRTETLEQGRRRLHPAGLRPLDRERRRQAVPHPDRLQHRRSTRRSTCRSGSPAIRSTCWRRISARPRSCSRSFRVATCSWRRRAGWGSERPLFRLNALSDHEEAVGAVAPELFDKAELPVEIGLHLLCRHRIGAFIGPAVAMRRIGFRQQHRRALLPARRHSRRRAHRSPKPICASHDAVISARMLLSSVSTMRAPRTGAAMSISCTSWPPA